MSVAARYRLVPVLIVAGSLTLPAVARAQAQVKPQTPNPALAPLSARSVPDWVRDGVVYEIFTRNFSPEGTFAGVEKRLPKLKELGATILWFMPIHPSGQVKKKGTIGSPYAVRDYRAINPDYGTPEDFQRLVKAAHEAGFKVILDVVANHTSWDNVLIEGHDDFYTKDTAGKIIPPNPDWSDVADLNYDNPGLRQYMIETLSHWITQFDVDGFRCDVAGEVPTDFWVALRKELEKHKPDVFLLAEASKPELVVEAFDADYGWPFHAALNDVLLGGQPASKLRDVWMQEKARFPRGAVHLYFSDNHDEKRAIVRFGEKASLAAAALMFGLDGVPLLYNGQEVGDTTESGAPALFEKMPVFWEIAERRPEFPRFFRQLIALRHDHPALRRGSLLWLPNSEDDRVLSFRRADAKEEILFAVNLSSRPVKVLVALTPDDDRPFTEITPTTASQNPAPEPAVELPTVSLEPWGVRVFVRSVKN